jgi:hypothetical protein
MRVSKCEQRQPGWITILKEGVQAARRAEVLLAYVSSFAARGDSVVRFHFTYLRHQSLELARLGLALCGLLQCLIFVVSFMQVLSTFLTLWISKYYTEHGHSSEEALSRGGVISGIAQTCALIFAPFVGFAADKLTRTMTLLISSVIATAGYLWMFLIDDPVGGSIIGGAILVGCGEIGTRESLSSTSCTPFCCSGVYVRHTTCIIQCK